MNTKMNNYLLILAIIVLFGAAKQALACDYDRISRIPDYDNIQEPKKISNIPQAHGLCVAASGDFAIIPYNMGGKFYLYHSCGKLMRVARLPNGFGRGHDCEFVQCKLYILDKSGKNYTNIQQTETFFNLLLKVNNFIT